MVRVLSRDQSHLRRLQHPIEQTDLAVTPGSEVTEALPGSHRWFGHPVDAAERERVLDAVVVEAVGWFGGDREYHLRLTDARRAATRLLDWFDSFPGESYQDRWIAADPDNRPRAWCPELSLGSVRRAGARYAMNALIMLGVVRPSITWLFDNKQSRFWRDWTNRHDKDVWDRYFSTADREHVSERKKWWGAQHLIRICIVNGIRVTGVRGGHVLAYRQSLLGTNRSAGDLFTMWHYARLTGLLVGEPDDLGALTKGVQRTPAELVDRHRLASTRVRGLLVDYVTEMSTSQDYGSLEASAGNLVGLFWKPIEDANPGIETIQLTRSQASAWKAWIQTKPDGNPRRNVDSILGTVRAFYLDIAAWAHEDPARWGPWAVPCPVSIRDVRGSARRRTQRTHRMQARTRALAPHLPALAARAEQRHHEAVQLGDRVQQTPVGDHFTFLGETYIRQPCSRLATSTAYVTKVGQTKRIDTDWQIVSTFMTWAFVDVLRFTGVRLEELLELTHLSIRQYRKPDGQVLPLLQIAPSKTDEERIVPCSPELTATLARLVEFVMLDGKVPLCVRRCDHERTYSAPLPHLFQVREAGRSRTISYGTVRNWLIALANDMGLRDVDGSALYFTPHDFRRLFITDLVNAGFPIHLAAKLVGHRNLDVTNAYAAVYQADVFQAYDRFVENRRQLRPSDEYREPTQQEWAEFVEHFGQRKIALGDCHRPYGSSCVHEHACIRCDFLQVDPGQTGRLAEIRTNLENQVTEAQINQWLGDVDQLRITIAHADRKSEQLQQRMTTAAGPLVLARPTADVDTV